MAKIWTVKPPKEAEGSDSTLGMPSWLPDAAEAIGGFTVNDKGVLEATKDRLFILQSVKSKITALPKENYWRQMLEAILVDD
jgi:hypothetical protein